jgi:hypothetical protein
VQQPPEATRLLADIAALLETEVLPAVQDPLRHRVRVAASLLGIIERELRLGPAAAEAERDRLVEVLDGDASQGAGLAELRQLLVQRLEAEPPLDDETDRAIHAALVATLRDDLTIAKPGYERWTQER